MFFFLNFIIFSNINIFWDGRGFSKLLYPWLFKISPTMANIFSWLFALEKFLTHLDCVWSILRLFMNHFLYFVNNFYGTSSTKCCSTAIMRALEVILIWLQESSSWKIYNTEMGNKNWCFELDTLCIAHVKLSFKKKNIQQNRITHIARWFCIRSSRLSSPSLDKSLNWPEILFTWSGASISGLI